MSVRQKGYLAPLSNIVFWGGHETSTCSRGNTGYLSGTTARHTFLSISPVLIGYSPSSNFCYLLHYRARTSLKAMFEPHVKFYFCGNAWEHSYRERYILCFKRTPLPAPSILLSGRSTPNAKSSHQLGWSSRLQTGGMFNIRSMLRCLI